MEESKSTPLKNSIKETSIWIMLLGSGNSVMPNKFTTVYAKFILAALTLVVAYLSYTVHYTISLKVIVLMTLALAWVALGTYNLLKLKKQ